MRGTLSLLLLSIALHGCTRAGFGDVAADLAADDRPSRDGSSASSDGAPVVDSTPEASPKGDGAPPRDGADEAIPWAPEFYRSFEGGTVGEQAVGADAASNTPATNPTLFSDENAHQGIMSGKATIGLGQTSWGAYFFVPGASGDGAEIWFRVYTFYPANFDFGCLNCTEGFGFLSLLFRNALTQEGLGRWGIALNQDGRVNVTCSVAADFVNQGFYDQYPWQTGGVYDNRALGPAMVRDVWTYHEVYLRLSSGADGIIRVWKDGSLVFENTTVQTLPSGFNAENHQVRVFDGWSAGAEQDQHAYIDSVAWSTREPPNRDAAGHPMIGDWVP